MSTNIVDISTKLKTMIGSISSINGVYDYAQTDVTSYPYAVVKFDGSNADFGDTIRNIRHYEFMVILYIDRNQASVGNEKAERLLRSITDEIITMFDNNTTLDNLVQMVQPISISTSFQNTDIGDTRVCEIVIDCIKAVDSIT